jgi:hypothetical protein
MFTFYLARPVSKNAILVPSKILGEIGDVPSNARIFHAAGAGIGPPKAHIRRLGFSFQ